MSPGKSNFDLHVCICTMRGGNVNSRNRQPFWNVNKHTKHFCIKHAIQKPLRLSAPIVSPSSKAHILLGRYNFHFLNWPLLVSLLNAQRHKSLFSGANPARAAKQF